VSSRYLVAPKTGVLAIEEGSMYGRSFERIGHPLRSKAAFGQLGDLG